MIERSLVYTIDISVHGTDRLMDMYKRTLRLRSQEVLVPLTRTITRLEPGHQGGFIEHGGGPKREELIPSADQKIHLRNRWIFCNKPRKSDEAGPWINIVRERSRRMEIVCACVIIIVNV